MEESNEPETILGLEVIDHYDHYDPFGIGSGHGQMSLEDIERHINEMPGRNFFLAKKVTAIVEDGFDNDGYEYEIEKTITADEGYYFLLWVDEDDWLDSFHF